MALTKEAGERLWLSRWEDWKQRAAVRHDGRFTYPSPERVGGKLRILCPEHGEFWQVPGKHMHGQGCPRCAGLGADKAASLAKAFPGWDWTGVEVRGSKEPISLTCPTHGAFKVSYNRLMTTRLGLSPCPACNKSKAGESRRVTVGTWKERIAEKHGDSLTLDEGSVGLSQEKARFVCKAHGEFWSTLIDVSNGHGCPSCGKDRFNGWLDGNCRVTADEFIARAAALKGGRYEYDAATYVDQRTPMRMICKEHGDFWQIPRNHTSLDADCPACSGGGTSCGEVEVADYIESLGFEVIRRYRGIEGREIDVYVPEIKVGVEYCGLYWHSDKLKGKNYHAEKHDLMGEHGITLYTVFEDEWLESKDKVKYKLLNACGANTRIYARLTEVTQVTWAEAAEFLNEHHLQGAGKPSQFCYGLRSGNELVLVATWGLDRFSQSGYLELYRLCSKGGVTVVGGLSKLVNHVRKVHDMPLLTYADVRWGEGRAYGKAGFKLEGRTPPGYFWCKGLKRMNRQLFQKHKLADRLKVFDPSLTEVENCENNGYWRVFDCGHTKWVLE